MNRTLHLKETLIRNIRDNSAYPNVEFVLLNYGSKDDMHEWVTNELPGNMPASVSRNRNN